MLRYPPTPRKGDQDHIALVGVPTTCLVACLMSMVSSSRWLSILTVVWRDPSSQLLNKKEILPDQQHWISHHVSTMWDFWGVSRLSCWIWQEHQLPCPWSYVSFRL